MRCLTPHARREGGNRLRDNSANVACAAQDESIRDFEPTGPAVTRAGSSLRPQSPVAARCSDSHQAGRPGTSGVARLPLHSQRQRARVCMDKRRSHKTHGQASPGHAHSSQTQTTVCTRARVLAETRTPCETRPPTCICHMEEASVSQIASAVERDARLGATLHAGQNACRPHCRHAAAREPHCRLDAVMVHVYTYGQLRPEHAVGRCAGGEGGLAGAPRRGPAQHFQMRHVLSFEPVMIVSPS